MVIFYRLSLAHDDSLDDSLVGSVKDSYIAHENGDVEMMAEFSSENFL